MARSTVHYHDNGTNKILKALHNKLRPAGTPIERVEYIIELLLLRIFEVKLKQDEFFKPLRQLFEGDAYRLLFSYLKGLTGEQVLIELNKNVFPFYATILTQARKVIKGNLPTKLQDYLVLTEEVFANSSFTNNVKGGLMSEVVGLVSELDEQVVLKTDLLGDAIESALSETGGTKDIGLYRTPGHIRKMMVEMVDPDFTDIIHDPACGTGGFLFDAYDHIIAKAEGLDQWPPDSVIEHFYRSGLSGVEYLGRIRKMSAVNMYIRGLNPHNIEQGDSLKLYDPAIHKESCTVVIANPPFGAECDQPAYPNVWEEYSREKETTILFVKLMFELLKKGGRCAVVVSEGFLTWGQNSASRLRQMLLQEANLRAIISLPQGVFVSKNGQGPKTSILYFEKGMPTNFVWYYKIENDGFSMGTNRQPIEGSQISELLEIWKTVKQGVKSEDTRYSFCIPRQWIETLDPRIKKRIRKETRTRLVEKDKSKKAKFVEKLEQDLNKKKISKDLYKERFSQYDELLEVQVQNTIAKEIERAHTYHFNLQNYRSGLTDEQIKKWREVFNIPSISVRETFPVAPASFAGEGQGKGGLKSVDECYDKLIKNPTPDETLIILATFDACNVLEMDIAREFLHNLSADVLTTDEKFKRLEEIVKKGFHYPLVPLKDLIIINEVRTKPQDDPDTEFVVLGVSNQTGIFINERLKGREIKQVYYRVIKSQFCYNPYRINVGSIGQNEFDCDNQIISGAYNVFGVNEAELVPKYLDALFKTSHFNEYVNLRANGGVRMDFKIEYMQDWQIPLPPLEIQREIVARIEKQTGVIEAAKKIEESWEIDFAKDIFLYPKNPIGLHIKESLYGSSQKAEYQDDGYPIMRINNIGCCDFDLSDIKKVVITENEFNKYCLNYNDFLIVRSNGNPDLVGKCAVWKEQIEDCIYASYLIRFRFNDNIDPRYVMFYFMSRIGKQQLTPKQGGGTFNINAEEFKLVEIPVPPLSIQQEIVAKLDKEMEALEGMRLLRREAERRIEKIIAEVWGG